MAKAETKMAETKQEIKPAIEVGVQKNTQKLLNLDTGKEEDFKFSNSTFTLRPWTKDDGDRAEYLRRGLHEAMKMVQPIDAQIKALCTYASKEQYDAEKAKALSGGNYVTQDFRKDVVDFLRTKEAYKEMSATDVFDLWVAGFTLHEKSVNDKGVSIWDPKKKKSADLVYQRVLAIREARESSDDISL